MITFCSHRALHPRIRDPCGNVKAFCCKTCGRTRLACLDFKTLEAASVLMAQNRRSNGVLERSSVLGAFRKPPPIFWAVGMTGVEIGANTANERLASGAEPANHRANQSLSGPCRRGRSDRPGAISRPDCAPRRTTLPFDGRHRSSLAAERAFGASVDCSRGTWSVTDGRVHQEIQSEMRSTRSPGARCPSSCLSFLQAVPNQSHNAVILSRVPRSPSRYGTSLSHHRPGKERTRPGLRAFHPTIVPLTRNPVPLQVRPVTHCKAPCVCPTLSGGCPLWCAASDAPIRGAPGPGLLSTQLQGPRKPVMLRAWRAWRCPRQWPEAPREPRTDARSLGVRSSSQRGSLQANPDSLLADSSTLFRQLNSLLLVTGNLGRKRQEFRGLRQRKALLHGRKCRKFPVLPCKQAI